MKNTILGLFNMFFWWGIRADVSHGTRDYALYFCFNHCPDDDSGYTIIGCIKKEGQAGQRQINKYTRQLTLALALVQSIGMCTGLISQNLTLTSGLGFYIPAVTSLVAGSMFLMWLGEQITERGIGNGISMLILAGIVATFPQVVTQSINSVQQGQMNMIALLIFSLLALAVVAGIVFIERAQRRIPVNYAQKQSQERKIYAQQQSHLPLKINMAGGYSSDFCQFIVVIPSEFGTMGGSISQSQYFSKFLAEYGISVITGSAALFSNFCSLDYFLLLFLYCLGI